MKLLSDGVGEQTGVLHSVFFKGYRALLSAVPSSTNGNERAAQEKQSRIHSEGCAGATSIPGDALVPLVPRSPSHRLCLPEGSGKKSLKAPKMASNPQMHGGADASIRFPVWHRTAERLQVLLKERPGIHQNRGAVTSGLALKGSLRHQCQDNHLHAS